MAKAKSRRVARGEARVGLALAGGGPEGAVYEIGALRALDEAIEGIDLSDLHVYVGVSAGSFVAALLANGLTSAQMCRAVTSHDHGVHPLSPETFFTPAGGAWLRGGLKVPRLFLDALGAYASDPRDLSLFESLTRLARALPMGMFDNKPIREYMEKILSLPGRTNDFREVGRRLIVVAADIDAGEAVRFGEEEWDHVPIATAVQASTALPFLYPPVEIEGRHYADGVLLKTLHASVALEEGADLLFCVNPLVPIDTELAAAAGTMPRRTLTEIGLPAVLSQTFRTIIHSRLQIGFEGYTRKYPDRDIVLLEPDRDDFNMFFTNIFSFSSRLRVLDHAWRSTRRYLRTHRRHLGRLLEGYGMRLRDEFLDDDERDVWRGLGIHPGTSRSPVTQALDDLLGRLEKMAASSPQPRRAPKRARVRKKAPAPPAGKRARRGRAARTAGGGVP